MDVILRKRTKEASLSIPGFLLVLEDLQRSMLVNGLSESTFDNYSRNVAQVCLRYNKLPGDLTHGEVENYLAELLNRANSVSQSEFKHAVYSLRYYFKTVGKEMNVKLPQVKSAKKLPVVLSKAECKRLFEAAKNLKHRLILMVIYSGGFRVKELINLKWSDVDADRMMVLVKRSKGNKDRYVPLSAFLLKQLSIFTGLGGRGDHVFCGSLGGKMSSSGIRFLMARAVKQAGISKRGVCLHTLRHSYATHLLEDGLDIVSIKELLGHSRIESTLTYLHVINQRAQVKCSPLDTLYGYDSSRLVHDKERFYRVITERKQVERAAVMQLDLFGSGG